MLKQVQHDNIMSLSIVARQLQADFGFHPVVAAEIEFYLSDTPDEAFWQALQKRVAICKYEKEKGEGQWEVAFAMHRDSAALAEQINRCKSILGEAGADFTAKPFADRPGSGLHIHVHLEDAAGRNVFFKRDEEMSETLKWSIGGLLATMHENMPVFAPHPESLARFTPGGNAPTTLSWGANNRTVAVRLPDEGAPNRHIEHRVAGADANPEAVIAAVLAGIHYGLQHQYDPGAQVYGDAGLEKYGLTPLIDN